MFDLYYMMGHYGEAIALFRAWPSPPWHTYGELAAAHAQLDQMDEAGAAFERYYETMPKGIDPSQDFHLHLGMCALKEDRDHWVEGYRKAGFDV